MANDQFDVYSSASWKKLFDYYNKKYFKSKLDNNTVVIAAELAPKDLRKGRKTLNFGLLVRSNKLKTEDLCFIHPPIIVINVKIHESLSSMALTLLHEMIHLSLAHKKLRNDHGREFKNEIRRLARLGAFDSLI